VKNLFRERVFEVSAYQSNGIDCLLTAAGVPGTASWAASSWSTSSMSPETSSSSTSSCSSFCSSSSPSSSSTFSESASAKPRSPSLSASSGGVKVMIVWPG